ncbi:MAG: MaoC/PaaZ C-terminal domain-containing protein [Candidatus Binatia bacterium]
MSQTTQVYFDDLEEGSEIPPQSKTPSTTQMFLFSAVTRNAHRIHYEKDFAASEGLANVLVHGPMQGAMLSAFVTAWMGDRGFLKRFAYTNRGMATPGETLTFKGRVRKKTEDAGRHAVDLELTEENARGEVLVLGQAVVHLPARGDPQ